MIPRNYKRSAGSAVRTATWQPCGRTSMIKKEFLHLPGVSLGRSAAIGLSRSLALLLDLLIVLFAVQLISFASGLTVPMNLWTASLSHLLRYFDGWGASSAWGTVGAATLVILARLLLSIGADLLVRINDESIAKALTSDLVRSFLVPQDTAIKDEKRGDKPNQTLAMLSTEGIKTICSYFSDFIPTVMQVLFMLVISLAFLAPINLWAGIIVTVGMVLLPLGANMMRASNLKYLSAHLLKYDKVGIHFEQASRGLGTLTIFGADQQESERIAEESEGFRRITMKILQGQLRSLIGADITIAISVIAAVAATVFTSPRSVAGPTLPLAVFHGILVAVIGVRLFIPERGLIYLVHDAAKAMKLGKQIVDARDSFQNGQVPATDSAPANNRSKTASGPLLTLSDLTLTYANGFTALHSISQTFPRHGFIGIAGKSGSGKSTLIKILSGQLPDYEGSALLDGREISSFAHDRLAHQVVAIHGTDKLFTGTIESNLDLGGHGVSRERMVQVLKRVDMWTELEGRGGLQAPVTAGGSNFSGGQRQRLCIARGLLQEASVYILDEATSAVDQAHDEALDRLLLDLSHSVCLIDVTHRLANIRHADRILVLDQGRIAEEGDFDHLMAVSGLFASLWREQSAVEQAGREASGSESQPDDSERKPQSDTSSPASATDPATTAPTSHATTASTAITVSTWSTAKRMASFLGSHRKTVAIAALTGLIGHLLSTASVMLATASVYSGFTGSRTVSIVTGILAAASALARGSFSYREQYFNHESAFSILRDVRVAAFNHVRTLSPAGLTGQGRGNLVAVLTEDIELLEVFYAHTLSPLMIAVGNGLIMTILLACINPFLGLMAFVSYLILGLLLPSCFASETAGKAYAERQAQGRMHTKILDYLDGKNTLLQFNATPRAYEDVMQEGRKMMSERSAATGYRLLNVSLADVISLILLAAFSLRAGLLAMAGTVNPIGCLMAVVGFATSFPSIISVSRLGAGLQPTMASARRVFALFDQKPQAAPVKDGINLDGFQSERAQRVSYSYPQPPAAASPAKEGEGLGPVLTSVDLDLKAGESVAIQGPNGSGKTTLIDLLMRFRPISGGELTVNGTPIDRVNTSRLRQVQTLSGQNVFIFDRTLRENIAIAKPDASDEEIREAARSACLDELIDQLPDGLDTPLDHDGAQLSDGQRQRVSIARAFLSQAQLMFFDEPTSNMDALLEAELMQALMAHQEGKTYLFVSHRPTTLAYADRLFTLSEGRLTQVR